MAMPDVRELEEVESAIQSVRERLQLAQNLEGTISRILLRVPEYFTVIPDDVR